MACCDRGRNDRGWSVPPPRRRSQQAPWPPETTRHCVTSSGLPVEPTDHLLERITGTVDLRTAVQLAMFKRKLKRLSLVCDNMGAGPDIHQRRKPPQALQANRDPAVQGGKASSTCQVYIAGAAALSDTYTLDLIASLGYSTPATSSKASSVTRTPEACGP